MSKSRLFLVAVSMAIIAFFACSQFAIAQSKSKPRTHRVVVHKMHRAHANAVRPNVGEYPPNGLYSDGYYFGLTSYPSLDSNNETLWPCWGGTTDSTTDCPGINQYGMVVGDPGYVWELANDPDQTYAWNINGCDGDTNGSTTGGSASAGTGFYGSGAVYIPCGQYEAWFQDDSNDTTDDNLFSFVVTQGPSIIYDTGTQDWGINDPTYNGSGGEVPPADLYSYGDINFGDMGVTGPNNGNCAASYEYPVVCTNNTDGCSATNPGSLPGGWPGMTTGWPFVIQAGKKCIQAQPGLATMTATTWLAPATWSYKANKNPETGGTWSVKYGKATHTLKQAWTIWLQ
jgi:hypothetical protein